MKIQAAVSRAAARPPAIETLDIEEPRAGEILVRLVASGICHTDINVHARDRTPKPIVLGHEGAGIVERVGSGVTRLAPGDPVVLSVNFCGTCPSCQRNEHSYCYEVLPRNFGGLRPDAMGRTLKIIDQELTPAQRQLPLPCDVEGNPL